MADSQVVDLNRSTITGIAGQVPNARGTLFMVHGSGGNHLKWSGLIKRMSLNLNCLALDLPGHGLSALPLCDSVEDIASYITTVIKTLNPVRPLVLAGHSLGAAVCLQTAMDYGEVLEGIILIGGGSRLRVLPSLLNVLKNGKVDPEFFRIGFAGQTSEQIIGPELAAFNKESAGLLYTDFYACDKFDVGSQLYKVKAPALMIVGDEDRLTPPKYSYYLQQNIPGSTIRVIPGAGHFVFLEKPEQVIEAIKEFWAVNFL